jgi:hypothetical protein
MIEKYNFLIELNLWFVLNCVVIFSGQFWKLVPEEAGTFSMAIRVLEFSNRGFKVRKIFS